MIAMNLIDSDDVNISYGILFCKNEKISQKMIQEKIYEAKDNFKKIGYDWIINDIIQSLPTEWNIYLQESHPVIFI